MGKKNKKVNSGGRAGNWREPKNEEELVKALKNLTVREISTAGIWEGKKFALLKIVRSELADKERLARRTDFIEKNREEIVARADFPQRMMQLFPEEVWEVIVKWAGSDEKALMTNMTRQWRRLLKEERTTFLMPEVFPILYRNGHLSPKVILKFRLACKDWKRGADTCLQNYVEIPGFNVENAASVPHRPEMAKTFPPGPGSYHHIIAGLPIPLAKAREHPYFARKIIFDFPNVPGLVSSPNFWRQAELKFRKFGHMFWHLDINLGGGLRMENVYDFLCDYLPMMPNLRSMGVSYTLGVPPNIDQVLKQRMAVKSLPELPDLRSLYLIRLPSGLVEAILRKYGPRLEALALLELDKKSVGCLKGARLPRMKRFGLQLIGKISEPLFPVDLPALEELEINFYPLHCDGGDILKLFQCLNSLRGSLRRLTLNFVSVPDTTGMKIKDEEKRRLWLDLPQLEDFKLSVAGLNLNTIDFILPMKSLKELEVKYVKLVSSFETKVKVGTGAGAGTSNSGPSSAVKLPEGIIQFGNHTNCLYTSNIWGLFPELTTVSVVVVRKLKKADQGPDVFGNGIPTKEVMQAKMAAILKGKMTKRKVYTRFGWKQQQQQQGGKYDNNDDGVSS